MKQILTISLFLLSYTVAWTQERPNIIIFISDDQNQMDVGCYGNSDVDTPNMDAMASEGMRFKNAYAASSMCTPSRSAIFTGLYPYKNGSQLNHYSVKPGIKSLPHHLAPLGYRVVLAGKSHIEPKSAFPFEYVSKEMGKYTPVELRSDPRGETIRFIGDHFKNNSDTPLCLIVATWWPHVPWLPNKDYQPGELNIPEYLVDTPETREALASYYQSIKEADRMLGDVMNAVKKAGQEKNTLVMFFSDQGAQFPGAKWTTYRQGLHVPLIAKWPGKIGKKQQTDALVSLVDIAPTVIDVAGGAVPADMDGKSFKAILTSEETEHRDYAFGESSMEPHYWYNYTPSRTLISSDGFQYIRNYNAGVRFITHIDNAERNNFYFNTWEEMAKEGERARFLLNRYSYRPPEEFFNLKEDPHEFINLISSDEDQLKYEELKAALSAELKRQGEADESIVHGQFPDFQTYSYNIRQGISAHAMSFERDRWNPNKLYVTAYIDGLQQEGIICEYFDQFRIGLTDGRLGISFNNGEKFSTEKLTSSSAELVMSLADNGDLKIALDGTLVITGQVSKDFTKIKPGYLSCGLSRLGNPEQIFSGKIYGLRMTMNKLNRTP